MTTALSRPYRLLLIRARYGTDGRGWYRPGSKTEAKLARVLVRVGWLVPYGLHSYTITQSGRTALDEELKERP